MSKELNGVSGVAGAADAAVLDGVGAAGGGAQLFIVVRGADGRVLTYKQAQKRYIEVVLAACDDNKTQAARLMGIDRRTLYRILARPEGVNRKPRRA